MTDSYLPGYVGSAARMVAARSAAERASFVPRQLLSGARVLDVGCGPGSITAGLAAQMGPAGQLVALEVAADQLRRARTALDRLRENVPRGVLGQASVYALPLASASVDLVFAHALFEHLTCPAGALSELRRVLRPGGALALVASDWSGARLERGTVAARLAIDGGSHGPRAARCAGVTSPDPVMPAEAVHALEHGAVWITYDPALLAPDTVRRLGYRVTDGDDLLLSPFPDLAAPLSLQSWGHRLLLDTPADPRFEQFFVALAGNPFLAPEPDVGCPPT